MVIMAFQRDTLIIIIIIITEGLIPRLAGSIGCVGNNIALAFKGPLAWKEERPWLGGQYLVYRMLSEVVFGLIVRALLCNT